MRQTITLAALAAAAVAAAVATTSSAQTTEGRTLTMFQDVAHESNTLVDNAPRSPAKSPESRRFRPSAGDELVARTTVLDRRGGKRTGTLYAHAAVVSGTRFDNALLQAQAVLVLGDGSIVFTGLAGVSERPFAVVGGTGAYEGARGSATEKETKAGTELTIRLLP
jgi:hypothetical protein